MVGLGAASPQQQTEEGWCMVSAQLELQVTVLQLVGLMAASTMAGRNTQTSPERGDQAPGERRSGGKRPRARRPPLHVTQRTRSWRPPLRMVREKCCWWPPFYNSSVIRRKR
ncbi:unnamed protein product [Lampetra fluviatilis]